MLLPVRFLSSSPRCARAGAACMPSPCLHGSGMASSLVPGRTPCPPRNRNEMACSGVVPHCCRVLSVLVLCRHDGVTVAPATHPPAPAHLPSQAQRPPLARESPGKYTQIILRRTPSLNTVLPCYQLQHRNYRQQQKGSFPLGN